MRSVRSATRISSSTLVTPLRTTRMPSSASVLKPLAREILTAARANGFKTLADDGVRLVRAGSTSLDEVMRVVDLTDRMA